MKLLKSKKTKDPIVINTECDCGSKLTTFDCIVYKGDSRINAEHLCIDCIKVATLNGSFVAL